MDLLIGRLQLHHLTDVWIFMGKCRAGLVGGQMTFVCVLYMSVCVLWSS